MVVTEMKKVDLRDILVFKCNGLRYEGKKGIRQD